MSCVLFCSVITAAEARTYLEVSPDSPDDLDTLFTTLEAYLERGIPTPAQSEPVIVILHGAEAIPFTRQGFAAHRSLVDRAALLDAYRLIDVRMCRTWMDSNGIGPEDIPAFIETVPFAPEEIQRLEAEGYAPYGGLDI